jgi:hypothetical protein
LIIRELISMVEEGFTSAKEAPAISQKAAKAKDIKRYCLKRREFIQTAPVKTRDFKGQNQEAFRKPNRIWMKAGRILDERI